VNGTGLGLFIVKAIAQKHGGKVFAASAGEGEGATITMELPRSNA
jgi:signal transduction histidine kinase